MNEGLLVVRGLTKTYRRKQWPFLRSSLLPAVVDLDLDLAEGSMLGLVGRSGCGKSTLARCIARLEQPDKGMVLLEGRDLLSLPSRELKTARRAVQIVFQHSATSINPRFSAIDAIAEPLRIQNSGNCKDRQRLAGEMMERVGIPAAWGKRCSLEFSGGERQRLALARALILRPRLLILDEALAALDRATQANISQLLVQLQTEFATTCLFITHDLLLAARLANRICVMNEGRIVENAPTPQLFEHPASDMARRLIDAIPKLPTSSGYAPAGISMRFLIGRLLHSVLLIVAASILAFIIVDLAPGDYFDNMRLDPNISPETVARIRVQYGLHRPLPVEYLAWVRSALHGDWGYSLAYNTPAIVLLRQRVAHTLLLSGSPPCSPGWRLCCWASAPRRGPAVGSMHSHAPAKRSCCRFLNSSSRCSVCSSPSAPVFFPRADWARSQQTKRSG